MLVASLATNTFYMLLNSFCQVTAREADETQHAVDSCAGLDASHKLSAALLFSSVAP